MIMASRLLISLLVGLSIVGESFMNSTTGISKPSTSKEKITELFLFKNHEGRETGLKKEKERNSANNNVALVNQFPPVFIMPAFTNATIEVPQKVAFLNYLVMKVKAIDQDPKENGKISYHIRQGNKDVQTTDEFSIDEVTGDLRTRIKLDGQKRTNYTLVLVAKDNGHPTSKETLQMLTIMLVDTDEYKPEFQPNSSIYHFKVPENSKKDIFIGKVSVMNETRKRPPVYYYIVTGNAHGGFYINKTNGCIFTNTSFDREQKDEYNMTIKATLDPDYSAAMKMPVKPDVVSDTSVAQVRVTILDLNDNPPRYEHLNYYAGVNAMASIGEFVVQVFACDPDLKINGSIDYHIAGVKLIRSGLEHFPYFLTPSPFTVSEDGSITTTNYMAEYNQQRIMLEVAARERGPPGRQTRTRVHIWVYQPRQLIRVILSRPPEEVSEVRNEIALELSNITQSLMVVDDIRYHVDTSGQIRRDWCDIYLHVVDGMTQNIMSVTDVLRLMDSKYYYLRQYYTAVDIENVTPAFVAMQENTFNVILAALIAMVTVLFIGCTTVVILCCCHSQRSGGIPLSLKRKEALLKQDMAEDLNDLDESPFWADEKINPCDNQELTMQVYCVPDGPEKHVMERHMDGDYKPADEAHVKLLQSSQHNWINSEDYIVSSGEGTCCLLKNSISEPLYGVDGQGLMGATFNDDEHLVMDDSLDPCRSRKDSIIGMDRSAILS